MIEELYSIYSGDPAYGFCSLDVVSMFDNIDMASVISSVKQLDPIYSGGRINIAKLVELIELDCGLLDYFRYTSPLPSVSSVDAPATSSSRHRYYRQIRGIPMGGNTSSLYADLVMSRLIAQCRALLQSIGVIYIRKYVDDFLV